MRRFLALGLCMVIGWSSIARSAALLFSRDPHNSGQCYITDPGPGGTVTVYIVMAFSTGATGVSFAAPVPDYAGLQYVGDTVPDGFIAAGNSQTHVDVSFGGCMTGSHLVMAMQFVRVGNAEPCTPYGAEPGATYVDCFSGESEVLETYEANLFPDSNCYLAPYGHPFPANGALDVPLNTILSWNEMPLFWCDIPIASAAATASTGKVYFGTTTNPPYDPSATTNHSVGPLSPATTYYWKIDADVYGDRSPLWSFTTTSTVPTKQSTWGAIKALYR